jgi:hypothetical protein
MSPLRRIANESGDVGRALHPRRRARRNEQRDREQAGPAG